MLFCRELARIDILEVLGAKDTVEKEMMYGCLHGHVF